MNEEFSRLLQASGGFSRTNNFRAEISVPEGLSRYRSQLDLINLACTSVEIPGFGLQTVRQSNGNARQPDLVSGIEYSEIDLNFYVSKSYIERTLFEAWRELQIDPILNSPGYYDDYIGEINLYPMKRGAGSQEANTLIGFRLINAYPRLVGKISYSYEEENTVAKIPVSISYLRYEMI